MSTNNQLIIIKKNGKYQVHENYCVDNFFIPSKQTLHKELKTLKSALKFCDEYKRENLVEYGTYVHPSCWEKTGKIKIKGNEIIK